MKYDTILWDFNGTILDDAETGIRAVNVLLSARSLPLIRSKEHYQSLFCFPIVRYYEKLGFDFEKESYADLADEWVAEYKRNLPFARVNPGVTELMDLIAARGLTQSVLSASETGMLKEQLGALGLLDRFDEIVGADNVRAYGKTALAVDYMKRHPGCRPLLIGDTDHDADTAREAGFDCVLLPCGHQPKEVLLASGCPVFPDFGALRTYLKDLI